MNWWSGNSPDVGWTNGNDALFAGSSSGNIVLTCEPRRRAISPSSTAGLHAQRRHADAERRNDHRQSKRDDPIQSRRKRWAL